MPKTYSILAYSERLKKMKRELNKAIVPPFRQGQKVMRAALIAEYWREPFAERIWEWRRRKWNLKGGPSVKLGSGKRPKYPRYSQSNQAYVAPINVRGLAAKMETGGRLRRHSFWGRSSRSPGAVVPRRRVYSRLIDKQFVRTVDYVSRSFWKFVRRLDL